jgi:hypothetical protein
MQESKFRLSGGAGEDCSVACDNDGLLSGLWIHDVVVSTVVEWIDGLKSGVRGGVEWVCCLCPSTVVSHIFLSCCYVNVCLAAD